MAGSKLTASGQRSRNAPSIVSHLIERMLAEVFGMEW